MAIEVRLTSTAEELANNLRAEQVEAIGPVAVRAREMLERVIAQAVGLGTLARATVLVAEQARAVAQAIGRARCPPIVAAVAPIVLVTAAFRPAEDLARATHLAVAEDSAEIPRDPPAVAEAAAWVAAASAVVVAAEADAAAEAEGVAAAGAAGKRTIDEENK